MLTSSTVPVRMLFSNMSQCHVIDIGIADDSATLYRSKRSHAVERLLSLTL